jgi:hypothetical protein
MEAIAMRNRLMMTAAAVAVGVLIVSLPICAHHGNAAFDTEKKVTVKGTVTDWTWANPHCYLKVDAKDEKGNVIHWSAEVNNPAMMTSLGWRARDFKVGDEVTLTLTTAKNGVPVGKIYEVILPDGRKLYGGAQPEGNAATEGH